MVTALMSAASPLPFGSRSVCAVALVLSCAFAGVSLGADIQLSVGGAISTPVAARDAARKEAKPVRILVGSGTYEMAEPLTLTAEDSQVTWEAAEGSKPVFSGGRKITGWKDAGNGLWKAEVPEVKAGTWYFEQLWINGRRAMRARTPNKGFLNMDNHASDVIFPGKTPGDANWSFTLRYISFVTSPAHYAEVAKITEAELPDVQVIIPQTWEVHKYRIQKRNEDARGVLLEGPRIWELLTHEQDGRFHVENYRAALDAPGEWFLSRSGELFYQPLPGEDMTKAEVIAPVAMKLVKMDGVQDFTFSGISFAHQNWLCGPKGHGDNQAAASIGAAVELDNCQRVRFDQCEIAHTGEYAIWFRDKSRDNSVEHSHLHDLGAGGVKIGPAKWASRPAAEDAPGEITVDDCIIQHGGRVFPAGIGFVVGHSGDNTLSHCDIGDFYYSGVSTGWTWGYGESLSHRNHIENNHIHHLGWGYISDMGGFYNLGAAFGTTVRGNHIHHVSSYRYGGWGLYTDEGSTDVVMEDNLVHDTSESSFHQHYGYYNTVRNNIFAFGGKAQIQRSRAETRLSFVFEKNIMVWDPAAKFLDGTEYNWKYTEKPVKGEQPQTYVMRKNLYWPLGGKMDLLAEKWTWAEWQKEGRDAGSLVADPMFEDVSKRDFRLKEGSPAEKIGFKPWDLSNAGVRVDGPRGKAWRELAEKESQFPNWERDSKPWPSRGFSVPLETFEMAGLKTMPIRGASADVDGKGDSIGVSDEMGSPIPVDGEAASTSSKRSLKVQDAPGLRQSYLPVLGMSPKWDDGTLKVSFDVMAQPGANWFVEMRTTTGGEFGAGPMVTWKDGQLTAGKAVITKLGALPAGEWLRVAITAVPGTGKWSVVITRQDGTKQEYKDLPCKPEWTKCHYVLWSSLGTTKTAYYLDNVSLVRE